MFNIALYLEKFKNIGQGERLVKEAVKKSVKEVMKFELAEKDMMIKNGEVIFRVSPAIKNAIYIKKAQILRKLTENGVKNVGDIR